MLFLCVGHGEAKKFLEENEVDEKIRLMTPWTGIVPEGRRGQKIIQHWGKEIKLTCRTVSLSHPLKNTGFNPSTMPCSRSKHIDCIRPELCYKFNDWVCTLDNASMWLIITSQLECMRGLLSSVETIISNGLRSSLLFNILCQKYSIGHKMAHIYLESV